MRMTGGAVFHVERSLGNERVDALRSGATAVGAGLSDLQVETLLKLVDLLLAWNRKVNLTALVDPMEALEGHVVDSLAVAQEVRGAPSLLDLGAGGGFPSLPLAVVLPQTRFVLVDAVGKKVGFLKAAIAALGLTNARAIHGRAEGRPEREGIPRAAIVVSRAFLPLPQWLALAPAYVEPGGTVLAMLGPEAQPPAVLPPGLRAGPERSYRLPRSGAQRRVASFHRG